MATRRPWVLLLLAAALSACARHEYVPRSGDLVFQTSRSLQSAAVQKATHSPYSHMGIVYVEDDGHAFVFEAADLVQATPLDRWIEHGEGGRFVAKRLRDAERLLTPSNLRKMRSAGEQLNRKPYDPYFEWSDERMYCSELVWKIYKSALGIEIGHLQKLSDFDLSDPHVRELARQRWGGKPPADEPVISPAVMFDSDRLVTVYK